MDDQVRNHGYATTRETEEDTDIRKGPWTVEEDSLLTHYITIHGEGHWNAAARCAGLKRTGKSCRLRWLNYLRPNVRRGNITLQEQLLILELHFRWGNRWSKIAQHLPGRTDNEIKNYWRTRVQKQAKQLKCDVNSKQFRETMRHVWIPRLMERIQAESESAIKTTACSRKGISDASESGSDFLDSNLVPEISDGLSDAHVFAGSTDFQNPPCGYYSDTSQSVQNGSYTDGTWGWHQDGMDIMQLQTTEQERSLLYGLIGGGSEVSLPLEELWNEQNIFFLHQQQPQFM